jgi:hypothetical protein
MRFKINYLMLATASFFLLNGNFVYGEFKAKNVVVVIGDQFRHDETFGDRSHKYIPHLWNDLVPMGSNCVTFYGNPSYLVLVHLATLTGSWKDVRRLKPMDYPDQPTMFEYYRKGLGKDKNSCYFVTSKHEFSYMNYSNSSDYGEDYGATAEFTKEKNNDEQVYQMLVANMKKNRPSLVVAILGSAKSYNKKKRPDEVERLRKGIAGMDNVIYKIWMAIQADPNYKDKTDFFFLNDHGDLIDHEDCDDECKRYWILVAIGPDIKKGYAIENKWRQINLVPTIGKILNFPTPNVDKDAKVMDDFFVK